MQEKYTFSSVVDEVVSRTGRGDRLQNIADYVNNTISETSTLEFFRKDLVEDQIEPDGSDPFYWEYPFNFRMLLAVRGSDGLFLRAFKPGPMQQGEDAQVRGFWYQAGNYVAFGGRYIAQWSTLDLAYYTYPARLAYYAEAARPARFDLETLSWTYLTAVTDEEKETARGLVTNWMIYGTWYDMVIEGTLAKLWKNLKDDRAVPTYSNYKQMQTSLRNNEPHDQVPG